MIGHVNKIRQFSPRKSSCISICMPDTHCRDDLDSPQRPSWLHRQHSDNASSSLHLFAPCVFAVSMHVHSSCRLLLITRTLPNPATTTNLRLLHQHHAKNTPLSLPISSMDSPDHAYLKWSPERLIDRVVFLEKELRKQTIRLVPLYNAHAFGGHL